MQSDNATDPNGRERDQLLQAIAALQEEQQRLTSLEAAREKAREQSWAASHKINEAEAALRKAQAEESTRLAYEFASGGMNAVSPISSAQLALEAVQAEASQIERIESALDSELIQVANRVNRAQTQVYAALAQLIVNSAEFQQLYAEQTKAWARIRGLRKAFALIQHELHGQMPQQLADRYLAAVSLVPQAIRDATGRPIATDEAPVQAWRTALEALLVDPDAALPEQV
jgi:hypothetical protein